jgi:hypothetical protein
MQFVRLAVLAGCSALAYAQAGITAPTLVPMDEQATILASPVAANPAIPAFQYSFGANSLAMLVTANPLLCGNTAAATGTNPTGIMPVYYSANGSAGTSPLPFVFGAASGSPSTSAIAYGATNVVYNGNQVRFSGDPLDALVCYGLDANGVHKVTRDLFADDFEVSGTGGLIGNSTVALNVTQLPNAGNGYYYIYTIDVTIPPLPASTNCSVLDCNFALIEGYDTSVLDPASGQWCLAQTGNPTSCGPGGGGTLPSAGDININYSNYAGTGISLAAPIAPAPAKVLHFYVYRKLVSTAASLPSSGAPVAMVALFSPRDLEENKLDDNVATGNNTLANVAPGVVNDSAYTAFTGALAALQEDTDSGTLTFNISDADSPESSGNLLHASVTLYLPGGIQVPVAADCGSTTPQSAPVTRTCTVDIPLNNGAFWDTAVDATYQGQFNNVATDITVGTTNTSLASASIQIVATDAQGKNGTPVSTPVHIFSSKNDAPVVKFDGNQMPSTLDANDSNSYPTWSCSIGASTCGNGASHYAFYLSAVLSAQPGPMAAFDELSSQTTAIVDYTGGDANGGNVQCTAEQGSIFLVPNGNPFVLASGAAYDYGFQLTNPPTVGSALCTLTMTDAESGGFPNGESAATAQSTFRIVVNP